MGDCCSKEFNFEQDLAKMFQRRSSCPASHNLSDDDLFSTESAELAPKNNKGRKKRRRRRKKKVLVNIGTQTSNKAPRQLFDRRKSAVVTSGSKRSILLKGKSFLTPAQELALRADQKKIRGICSHKAGSTSGHKSRLGPMKEVVSVENPRERAVLSDEAIAQSKVERLAKKEEIFIAINRPPTDPLDISFFMSEKRLKKESRVRDTAPKSVVNYKKRKEPMAITTGQGLGKSGVKAFRSRLGVRATSRTNAAISQDFSIPGGVNKSGVWINQKKSRSSYPGRMQVKQKETEGAQGYKRACNKTTADLIADFKKDMNRAPKSEDGEPRKNNMPFERQIRSTPFTNLPLKRSRTDNIPEKVKEVREAKNEESGKNSPLRTPKQEKKELKEEEVRKTSVKVVSEIWEVSEHPESTPRLEETPKTPEELEEEEAQNVVQELFSWDDLDKIEVNPEELGQDNIKDGHRTPESEHPSREAAPIDQKEIEKFEEIYKNLGVLTSPTDILLGAYQQPTNPLLLSHKVNIGDLLQDVPELPAGDGNKDDNGAVLKEVWSPTGANDAFKNSKRFGLW